MVRSEGLGIKSARFFALFLPRPQSILSRGGLRRAQVLAGLSRKAWQGALHHFGTSRRRERRSDIHSRPAVDLLGNAARAPAVRTGAVAAILPKREELAS